jgi:uncharacterized protein (DUF433 family)
MRTHVAPHVTLDERGIAYIDDTETKVLTVVRNKKVSRDTPEQLRTNMPHLTLAQVYTALAYYLDNQEEVHRQMAEMDRMADQVLANQPPGPSRQELLSRRNRGRARAAVS